MALSRIFELGILLKATDKASSTLKKFTENLEGVKGVVAGFAGMEIFKFGTEQLEGFVETAADMQTSLARVSATTGLAGEAMKTLREHAENLSETNFAVGAEQYVAGFGRLYQNLHNTAAAMKAADVAAKASAATGAGYADVIGLVNAAHETFQVSAGKTASLLAATQRLFAMGPEDMSGFTYSIARMAGAAKQSHTPLSQLFAIAGEAGQLLPGGRGAQLMASLVSDLPAVAAKANLNMSGGLLGVLSQIKSATAGLGSTQAIEVMKSMGIDKRLATELEPLLDNLDKVKQAQLAISGDHGAALASGYGAASATFQANVALFEHAWSNLRDTLGQTALPAVTSAVQSFASMVEWLRKLADRYPIVGKIVIGLGGLAALGGGMAAVGAAAALIGSGLGAISAIGAGAAAGVTMFSGALGVAATAMEGLSIASLAFNPLAWAALAAAAALLIYHYWGPIKKFFAGLLPGFFEAGANLMKSLGSGILSAITAPARAISHVADVIRAHLPFSPAKLGPLRDLHRLRIVQTIAETMKPTPVLHAIRRVAAAAMIAAPILATPIAAAAAGPAAMGASAGVTSHGITINHSVVINGTSLSKEELVAAMRQASRELKKILDDEVENLHDRKF
jgi:hypothetical protein